MSIIQPDYYYCNRVDPMLLKNPLTQAQWSTGIDDPFFEIAGLSFYSLGWATKYLLNTELAQYQMAWLCLLWQRTHPMILASRGASKTFILAVYSILRALFDQGSKVVIVSHTFRQAKHVFAEIEAIYKRAPLLRACTNHKPHTSVDHCMFRIGNSTIKALPMGNGENIRGERASHIIVDEIDSVDPEIFHVVVHGFAATQLDPMTKIKEAARRKRSGHTKKRKVGAGNQIVIAGTAGFENGNFHKLYTQHRRIIDTRACGYGYELVEKLGCDLGDIWIDYKEYGIMELPWRFVPEGMLDRDMIASAAMTMSKMLFDMEYNCTFANTSRGFFKYEDIQNATAHGDNSFIVRSCDKSKQYVMGIDPARTSDAFAISILELGQPRRYVYCWAAIDKSFSITVRKILELLSKFNIVRIGMDDGGGGLSVRDMLNDPGILDGELPVVDYDLTNKSKEGRYILQMVNFQTKWIEDANFMLQKNIEDCDILFPSRILGGQSYRGVNIPILEDIHDDIEECKRELSQISVTQTITGRRHFDIQPSIEDKKRKIKPRKDRYTSLLIANFIANELADHKNIHQNLYKNWCNPKNYGGWVDNF